VAVESSVSVVERTLYKLMLDFTDHVQVFVVLLLVGKQQQQLNDREFTLYAIHLCFILLGSDAYFCGNVLFIITKPCLQ